MPLQISIPDNDIKDLNQPAKDELVSAIQAYIAEVLDEASRFEAANNNTNRPPQIVSSNINDAVLFLRRGHKNQKKPWWFKAIQFVSAISAAIFGIMFDYDKMNNPLFVIVLFVVFATVISSTIFVITNE